MRPMWGVVALVLVALALSGGVWGGVPNGPAVRAQADVIDQWAQIRGRICALSKRLPIIFL